MCETGELGIVFLTVVAKQLTFSTNHYQPKSKLMQVLKFGNKVQSFCPVVTLLAKINILSLLVCHIIAIVDKYI